MGWRLIQQDDGETLRILAPKLVQKNRETIGVQARQFPPERLPCRGFGRGIQPVIFIQRLDDLPGLHAIPCEATADGEVQAQTRFILAKEPYRLGGCLPS